MSADSRHAPDSPRFRSRLLAAAIVLASLGAVAFAVDVPVAAWFKDGAWPAALPKWMVKVAGEVGRLVTLSEVVAHTASVGVILALVLRLDPGLAWPSRRAAGSPRPVAERRFLAMLGATVAGGITTDVIKLMVERVRPRAADFVLQSSVWDSFRESVIEGVVGSRSNIHSFPSGHSAMAAGLAAALSWRYPRGRRFFATFAVMAAAQRILSSAHFPSDTLFGLAIGLAGAACFLGGAAEGPAIGRRGGDGNAEGRAV